MTTTDLIIIGAGPGGYRAAEYAAKQGLKVVIFEAGEVGGTCLNVGCIPTKTYVHSATFAEARERMAAVVPQLRAGVESILSHPNITLVKEACKFIDANCVNEFTAPHIIIATGSETKWLPIEGEYLKECLPALDSDIAKRLRKQMEKAGITFHMQCAVKQIADGKVFFEDKKGNTQSVEADMILMATGRKPRTEGLGLEHLGITLAPNGAIPTDDNFRAGREARVFAIGDVNGRQMLAHAAEMQAVRAVNQILGKKDNIRFDIMPAAIFTSPEAACVGPTEDQLKEQGIAYECKKSFWRANGKALAMGETEGMLKLFVAAEGGLILGCHAYGAHAADIVQEVSVLMCKSTTLSELADMVHIHPTLSEILKSAAD